MPRWRLQPCKSFNSQPPEGGWGFAGGGARLGRRGFNSQPPEGGWSTQGNALGSATTEYDFGPSTNFEQFKAHQFPFDANLSVEVVTNGKTQKLKITAFQPKNTPAPKG